MLTSMLERFLVCLHKEYCGCLEGYIELAEKHDPELGRVARDIGERIMGPALDLEAKRQKRERDQA